MKYWTKNYGDYDINLESFDENISELDKHILDKAIADKEILVRNAIDYIKEIVDFSKPMFEGGFILNSINIYGTSERSYKIEIELYLKNDECMYWYVNYNLPLIKANKESVSSADYWPIEFARRVE